MLLDSLFDSTPEIFHWAKFRYSRRVCVLRYTRDPFILEQLGCVRSIMTAGKVWPEQNVLKCILLIQKGNQSSQYILLTVNVTIDFASFNERWFKVAPLANGNQHPQLFGKLSLCLSFKLGEVFS